MSAAETPLPPSALPAPSRRFRILPSAESIRAGRFLMKDAVWRYKWNVLLVVLIGFLAPFLQATLFLLLFNIIKAGATGPIKIDFFKWSTRLELTGEQVLASAIGVSLALGIVAWMIYLVKKMSIDLAERYQMYSGKQALSLLFTREEVCMPKDCTLSVRQYLSRAIRVDGRLTGRCFAQILYLPVPLISLCVYFGVLVYLDPRLTGVLALVMPLAGLAQLVVIRRAAYISEQMDTIGAKVNAEVGELIQARCRSTTNIRDHDKFLDEAILGESHFRNFISLRAEMLLLTGRAQAINDIFSALTIAIVIGTFAWGVGFKVSRLAEIAAYLVVLRFVSVNAKSLSAIVTILNKFMPQTRRYIEFVLNNPADETDTRKNASAPPALISLLMLDDLDRYNASHVASQILGINGNKEIRIHAAIIDPEALAPASALFRMVLGLEPETNIHHLIERTWGKKSAESFPAFVENATCAEVVDKLGSYQIFQLLIAAELAGKPTLLYLNEEDLSLLTAEESASILEVATKVPVVLVQEAPYKRVGALEEERFVILQDGSITGDFNKRDFQSRKKELLTEMRESRARKRAADKRSGLEEEDELEAGGGF